MARLRRDVSHDRMVRFLRRHGWSVVREGARHTVLGLRAEHVAVPRHAVLKTGTAAAILRHTGLTEASSDL